MVPPPPAWGIGGVAAIADPGTRNDTSVVGGHHWEDDSSTGRCRMCQCRFASRSLAGWSNGPRKSHCRYCGLIYCSACMTDVTVRQTVDALIERHHKACFWCAGFWRDYLKQSLCCMRGFLCCFLPA